MENSIFTDKSQSYLKKLKVEYANGSVLVRHIELDIKNYPNNLLRNREEILRIMRGKSFLDAVPEHKVRVLSNPKLYLEEQNVYHFYFSLCSMLQFGGAYSPIGEMLHSKEVLDLSKAFFLDFLKHPLDYNYFYTYSAWSDWFHNVAWDYTAILISKDYSHMKLFCTTDTD